MAWRTGLVNGNQRGVWGDGNMGKITGDFLSPLTALLLSFCLFGFAAAQRLKSSVTLRKGNITVRVFLEEPTVYIGGAFSLNIQVTAPGALGERLVQGTKYELPSAWSDRVIQLNTFTDVKTVEKGGQTWTVVTYTHRLAPRWLQSGRIRFDGLSVVVLREKFVIPTIEGLVLSGAYPEREAPSGPPVKLIASVQPRQIFVGEQVIYTLRFSALLSVDFVSNPTYEAPKVEGCWMEEFPRVERERHANYDVQIVRLALFPFREGEVRVGSAKVTVRVQGEPLSEELTTNILRFTARPLPQPSPEGFQNLVGKVVAKLTVNPQQVSVGEVVTVRLKVEGTANLRNLDKAPPLSISDARVGIPRDRTNVGERNGKLWFEREFEWRIVPLREGKLSIPSFRIPYFDPQARQYRIASTSPVTVRVLPGVTPPAVTQAPTEARPMLPLVSVALSLIAAMLLAAVGIRYWQRQRWLSAVPVPDPQLRQSALTLKTHGADAFRRSVRNWLREQIYQRTGVLLSPNESPDRVHQLLTEKGVGETAARFAREVWERTSETLSPEEALNLLQQISEVPQRL